MAQQKSLADWHDGDPLSAAHWQEAVDMLRPFSSMSGGGITEVTQFPEGTTVYTPEQPAARAGMFLCVLESDGGTGGTGGSPTATWTYSVWREGANTSTEDPIATTQSPMKRLPGILSAGTYGTGTYDSTGTFRLWDTNEAPTAVQCA